jgi:SAM-dependent methyltransferase
VPLERPYVLGTHDEEIARLALQHRVWRTRAAGAWQRAGFQRGHHIVDLGCGPGFATRDLARLVGPEGRVTAIDRSGRFLAHLRAAARGDNLHNIDVIECDLDDAVFENGCDGAWARWALAFVRDPRSVLARVASSMSTGSVMVMHEYFDYATWRTAPRTSELDEFVAAVMASWRSAGGEPDIALAIAPWLEDLGFRITHLRPMVDVVTPADPQWHWLAAFLESGRKRLVAIGALAPERSEAIAVAARRWAGQIPAVRMVTPAVLEIIAVRR